MATRHSNLTDFSFAPRFWASVQKSDSCWTWTGRRYPGGYGEFSVKHVNYRAHRVSWMLNVGPIPDGLLVCHHCDNRLCVRPDHLFLGTDKDNQTDAIRKGRHARGRLSPEGIPLCMRGHLLTPGTFYVTSKGNRLCKKCQREYQKRWRAENDLYVHPSKS